MGILCPPAVISDWQEAAKAWGVKTRFVTSYHKAIGKNFPHTRWTHNGKVCHWVDAPPLLIFDEAQNMKSGQSKMGKLARGVVNRSTSKALLLSATPAETPLDFINNGEILGLHDGSSSFRWWAKAHGCGDTAFSNGALVWLQSKADQVATMGKIRKDLDGLGVVFGMRWAEAGLEHGAVSLRQLDLKPEHLRHYRSEKQRIEWELGEPHLTIALRMLVEQLKTKEMVAMAREFYNEGRHVVLFLNHTAAIDKIAGELGADILDGRTKDKDAVKKRFQNNEQPFLVVQNQAGGTGLSLQDLHGVPRASIISPGWSSQQFRQVLGRIDRANQVSLPVQVVVTCRRTIEDRVGSALKQKLRNLDAVLDQDLELS